MENLKKKKKILYCEFSRVHTQKRSETHPQLNLTYATFVDIHRLHTMCHAWKASHILLKPIKRSDRRI